MVGTLEQYQELERQNEMAERPYTVATLAERWQCSDQHIRDLIHKGELSCFRAGRLIRIPASEVERFESNTNYVTDEPSAPPPRTVITPING